MVNIFLVLPRVTELVVSNSIGQRENICISSQESGPATHQAVNVDRVNAGIQSANAAKSAAVASTSQVGRMLAIVDMVEHVMTTPVHMVAMLPIDVTN